MFCGTVGTDCPYVTHTHHQSSGKCTHLKGFHFSVSPCWTCQRNFAASPYTFVKNAWLNLSQMDFPHVWALIKERKQQGGAGGRGRLLPRNVSVEAFVRAARASCLSVSPCVYLRRRGYEWGLDPIPGVPLGTAAGQPHPGGCRRWARLVPRHRSRQPGSGGLSTVPVLQTARAAEATFCRSLSLPLPKLPPHQHLKSLSDLGFPHQA